MSTNTPGTMRDQVEAIATLAQQLSKDHRLTFPIEGVSERLREVLGSNRVLFHEWTLDLLFLLDHCDVLRYGQLKNLMPGISTRTLATKLAQLASNDMVLRTSYDEIPPRVEYKLTPTGRRFTQTLFAALAMVNHARPPATSLHSVPPHVQVATI